MKRDDGSRTVPSANGAERPFLRMLWRSGREQWRRFALLGVLAWGVYSLVLSPGGAVQHYRLRREAESQHREMCRLEAAWDSLETLIQGLERGDSFLLERAAREKYGFARSNELIYLLPSESGK
jgi:cell division protein FtsB